MLERENSIYKDEIYCRCLKKQAICGEQQDQGRGEGDGVEIRPVKEVGENLVKSDRP